MKVASAAGGAGGPTKNRSRKAAFKPHYYAFFLLLLAFLSIHFLLPTAEFCLNKKYLVERNQLEKLHHKVFSNLVKRIGRIQEAVGKNGATDEPKNNALVLPVPFAQNRSKKVFESAFGKMDELIEKVKTDNLASFENTKTLNKQIQDLIAEKNKLQAEYDERVSNEKMLSDQISQLNSEKREIMHDSFHRLTVEKNKTRNLMSENKRLKQEVSHLDTKVTKLAEIDIQLLRNYKKEVNFKSNSKSTSSVESGNYIFSGEHKYVKKLCGYSEQAISGIIESPHECTPGGRNIYLSNKWRKALYLGIYMRSKQQNKHNVLCLIACFNSTNGCPYKKCLVPIHIRPNTSDAFVVKQMLEIRELSILYRKFQFQTILDAGGNIGLASLFLSVMFPNAKIVTIEPSQSNFAMLKLNTNQFPNIFPLKAALWYRVSKLALAKGDDLIGEEWGFRVYEMDEVPEELKIEDSLQGVSVDFLLNIFDLPNFDFVKMDIEGSEQEVFNTSLANPISWVQNSKMIILEWHDHMRRGSSRTSREFFKSIESQWIRKRNMGYEIFKNANWSQQFT